MNSLLFPYLINLPVAIVLGPMLIDINSKLPRKLILFNTKTLWSRHQWLRISCDLWRRTRALPRKVIVHAVFATGRHNNETDEIWLVFWYTIFSGVWSSTFSVLEHNWHNHYWLLARLGNSEWKKVTHDIIIMIIISLARRWMTWFGCEGLLD